MYRKFEGQDGRLAYMNLNQEVNTDENNIIEDSTNIKHNYSCSRFHEGMLDMARHDAVREGNRDKSFHPVET